MRHAGGWLALAALTVFPFSTDNFELPHLLVLCLGAVVLAYRPATTSRDFAWCAAAIVSAALITTLTSASPAFSIPGLISLLIIFAFGLMSDGMSWRPVLWTTWPIAAWALLQGLGLDPVQWSQSANWCGGVRPFSTLGHPTQLGVWMALVCVLAVDDAFKRKSLAMGLTALVAGVTCGVTLSRAGWLALAVGLSAWWWPRRGTRFSWKTLALAGAGVVSVLLVAKGPAVLERVTHFFVAPTRVQLWGTALAGFRQHPWLGWGYDTFTLVDQQLRHPDAWKYEWGGTAGHAHSLLPQTLATQGLVGLLALVGAVFLVVKHRPLSRGAEGAVVVALAAASMVTFSGTLVAALGVCALARVLEGARRELPGWWPLALVVLSAVTLMMFGASIAARARPLEPVAEQLEPWNAQWPAVRGEALEESGRLGEALAAYERARELAPLGVFEANVGRVASKQGDPLRSRAAFERARRLAPLDGRIALEAAEASLRVRDLALAEGTLVSLLTLYPTDGPAWFTLGRVRLLGGSVVEARAALEQSLSSDWRDWPEGLGLARELLSQVLRQTGDLALAAKVEGGPERFALPAEICGAPTLLKR